MKKFVVAIDQGTTSTRCMIFDHAGKSIGSDQMEHAQIYPQPGWVEHNPMEIWKNTKTVIINSLAKSAINIEDIASIGITNQRETTVIWDRFTGLPLYNAIVWQDTRTNKIINRLAEDGGINRFRKKIGLPLATYFSGPKIMWLIENVPEISKAIEENRAIVGTIDTWIIWNLTGGTNKGKHITDVTNASRTMLMNLKTLNWDESICTTMAIPKQILPKICSSSEIYGHSLPSGPFQAAIPIAGNLGDQHAAMIGQTCFEPGEAKNTYGTGCFMLLNTGEKIVQSENGLLTTVCYQFGNEKPVYALEGSIAITGSLVQWLRDNLQMIKSTEEIEKLAATVEDNGGIYFVPAFSGLFAPYWRSDARGVIVGLTSFINRGHIARAVLEATAFQTREVLDAMDADSGVKLKTLKVDGGMVRNNLLMQFQSDVLGVPVVRPSVEETTALGAAYAAGYAVGFWKSKNEMKKNWKIDKTWQPNRESIAHSKLYRQWKKAVTRTFDWVE
jgi:glycerol kinase